MANQMNRRKPFQAYGTAGANLMAALLCVAVLIALCSSAATQSGVSATDREERPLQLPFNVLTTTAGNWSITDVCCDQDLFAGTPPQTLLKTEYGQQVYWIRFAQPARPGVLVLSAVVDEAVLYVRDPARGTIRASRVGDSVPVESRRIVSAMLAFPITDDDIGSSLFMKIVQPTAISLRFGLDTPEQFSLQEYRMNTIRAALIGAIVIIILYNLVLSVITRDATFLFNALTIFSLLLLDLYLAGVGAAYIWGPWPWVSNWVLTIAITGPVIFGSTFFYLFLRDQNRSGFAHIGVFFVLPVIAGMMLTLRFFLPYWMLQPIALLLGLGIMIMMTTICGSYAVRGDRRAMVLLFPLVLGVAPGLTIVSAQKLAGVEFPGLDQHLLEITLVLEALLFSFALAYRIRFAEQEKDLANAKLNVSHVKTRHELLKAVDTERTRIANELHDTAAHGLLSVSTRLTHMGNDTTLPNSARSELCEISKLSAVLIGEMRRISHDLHSGVLQHLGLVKAIEGLLRHVRLAGIQVDEFGTQLPEHFLTRTQQVQIFRIVQELLTNIVKHADATSLSISLKKQDELAILTINDNGRGMSSVGSGTGGLGLGIANQRAADLGAEWVTELGENGTTVRLTFPISAGGGRSDSYNQNYSVGRQSSDFPGGYQSVNRGTV